MKTAISIPDPIFKAAERFARRLGMSRSALYSQAVERYLREHRHYGVTEKLNEVYGETDSNLDSELVDMQHATLQGENIK
ncbi:MAG: ChpI protein [Proteobacteria bacterium]|nr:ChpI protein [Pseudomonadota bacterium]